jgi:DNA mismatch endonuclease (patch repair protein)
MTDVFSAEKRSEVMSLIRSKGNKGTELALMLMFRASKISGWRRHPTLIGKPDFCFQKQKVAIFVDGCFWHGCPQHSNIPHNNRSFWQKKISSNKLRDRYVNKELRALGWSVIRLWEHDIKRRPQACIKRVQIALAPNAKSGLDRQWREASMKSGKRLYRRPHCRI